MTALRNTPLAERLDASRTLLDALDGAGYAVRTIDLTEDRLSIHLADGTARAAVAALGLTVERAGNFSGKTDSPAPFSVADCTLVTIPITVYGDYNPQVHDDDEPGAAFDHEFGAMGALDEEAVDAPGAEPETGPEDCDAA
jgi:hypothetical protein